MDLNQITLPAVDIEASKRFYRRMGFLQIVDSPHYARFSCPVGGSTFSLHQVDRAPESGVVLYFESEQLDEQVELLQGNGFQFHKEPTDERWLWREARLKDPSGNEICLYWAGENRTHPPWRVELRED